MNQHNGCSLPPPPPSPRALAGTSSQAGGTVSSQAGVPDNASGGVYPQRSRPVSTYLPSISTSFLNVQGAGPSQASTPVSAARTLPVGHNLYSPATPSAVNRRTPGGLAAPPPPGSSTRVPAMEPYNPRQWSRNQVSGSQMVFQQRQSIMPASTSQITGMEAAMPSPPPPYSPATPDNSLSHSSTSQSGPQTSGYVASPLVESSSRNSPQIPMSPAFPPPPPQSSRQRDRSASGNKSFFSLSSLRGKQPVGVEQPQQHASSAVQLPSFVDARPPAAKRAASTGHIQASSSASSSAAVSVGRASPETGWQHGMPLPGPPPGPPPPGARSQSLNRPAGLAGSGSTTPERFSEVARPRKTIMPPTLGPVPPTPADWIDQEHQDNTSQEPVAQPQQPQPESMSVPLQTDLRTNRDSSLYRRHAHRDASTGGIRERRSQSRAAKGTDDIAGPSDLVFSTMQGAISRRREHTRTASGITGSVSAPTSATGPSHSNRAIGSVVTPPYTPAVGKQPLHSGKKHALKAPSSASSDRPISHLLHTPNEDGATMPAPLSPSRPATSGSTKSFEKLDSFATAALERHRLFVQREAAAATDEERLELFANFLVHESRLRRDRYTVAYNAMAGEIVDLTRDMWRPYAGKSGRRAPTPSTSMSSTDPTVPSWASDGRPGSAYGNMPSSASSMGEFTPATDAGSVGDFNEGHEREARQWPEAFKPSLSPIPSMAVSTVPDESSSRGRQPSRWWEQSLSGAGSIGKPDRLEKSRRETKYMGINPASLQISAEDAARYSPTASINEQNYVYGPDEYPPEKLGWHEGLDYDTPMATPNKYDGRKSSTPGVEPLNVSRLVTLPPPYPRHHPAVNNSHPLLAELRSEHRTLADHSEIQKIKDAYLDQDFALSREQQEAAKQRRAKLRTDIQSRVADGAMSYAEAAQAEADFEVDEAERGKTTARSNFDIFEAHVSHPLNALLTERLGKASDSIKRLRTELEGGRGSANPNQAQEEGDEHPERLEKLTLLKWLFEAREQMHKEMFDLHAMRSEKYSEVILTPLRISKAQAKIDEATTFFKKDSTERQITYARDSLKRFEELQTVMENNVSRGVEDQLSAFWDIAPGLLEVIQQIPSEMMGFDIDIPPQEYEENPSYHEHPLQYLHSLLNHAEKSAYQFIESQINLLCLLHEVRTATSKSRLRLVELERVATSAHESEVRAEMEEARRDTDAHLTRDLKEKVAEVEGQWQEALGHGIKECKDRVGAWLEETGGLEDGLGD